MRWNQSGAEDNKMQSARAPPDISLILEEISLLNICPRKRKIIDIRFSFWKIWYFRCKANWASDSWQLSPQKSVQLGRWQLGQSCSRLNPPPKHSTIGPHGKWLDCPRPNCTGVISPGTDISISWKIFTPQHLSQI